MRKLLLMLMLFAAPFILGCLDTGDNKEDNTGVLETVQLDKYSERADGSTMIEAYRSPDNVVRATVYNYTGEEDFEKRDLLNRIKDNSDDLSGGSLDWSDGAPEAYDIDGHIAISTMILEVTESGTRTNRVRDRYVTAIAHPETDSILIISSNGDNMTWELHSEIVQRLTA